MSRPFCYRCYRPQTSCICDQIKPVDNQLNILILQHPDEIKHPKGSAIIAKRCLENVHCLIGEDFSHHQELNRIIDNAGDGIALIFPGRQATNLNEIPPSQNNIQQLVFIDASWRKARKIFLSSPNLQELKTISLPETLVSNYRIRKSPAAGHVSTIEAICHCLQHFEPATNSQVMLDIFKEMVDRQIDKMGKDRFLQNYKKQE